jgi:hypothetical protein
VGKKDGEEESDNAEGIVLFGDNCDFCECDASSDFCNEWQ